MPKTVKNKKPTVILGIDPGTLFMGYGIIERGYDKIKLIHKGTLKLRGIKDPYERLFKIHEKVTGLIQTYSPDTFAIEAPFYGKNVQSMLKLGRAQGVALAAALQAGLKASEYSPRKVKKAITGNGNAGKEQVAEMVGHILKQKLEVENWDATDALAVAICHHFQLESALLGGGDRPKDWKAFIKMHPEKVRR